VDGRKKAVRERGHSITLLARNECVIAQRSTTPLSCLRSDGTL